MQNLFLGIVTGIFIAAFVLYAVPSLLDKINDWNDRFKKANEINGDKYYCDDKAIAFVKDLFEGTKNVSIGAGFLVGVSIIRDHGVNGTFVDLLSAIGAILVYLPFFVWSLKIIKAFNLRNNERKFLPGMVILVNGIASVVFLVFYLRII